jgi:hypothetical protein
MCALISISACGRRGYPLRPHTRSGGAPHYAPSLRSVAGLLGRSLDAAYEDTLASLHRSVTARDCKARRVAILNPGDNARNNYPLGVDLHPADGRRGAPRAQAREQLSVRVTGARIASTSAARCGVLCRAQFRSLWEGGRGVLVGALQSEREEETRDRAERGSAVRGSDQASVAPERISRPTDPR